MGRSSRYSLQAQALQRFEKNLSISRRANAYVNSGAKRRTHHHHHVHKVAEINPVAGPERNVTLMRAIYSEARWQIHEGVLQSQARETSDSQPKQPAQSKLQSTFRAVCAGTKQVYRGQRSVSAWKIVHEEHTRKKEEEKAKQMLEDIQQDFDEGKVTSWSDAEEHITKVVKTLFPEDTEETQKLMTSFKDAADSFKELSERLNILKKNSSTAAAALAALQTRSTAHISSVSSKCEAWATAMQDIERIRRESQMFENSYSLGATAEPGQKLARAKRSNARGKTQLAPQLHTEFRSNLKRSATDLKSEGDDEIDNFLKSISGVRANLKTALLAKRVANKMRNRPHVDEDSQLQTSLDETPMSEEEASAAEAVSHLEELLCHAALNAFGVQEHEAEGCEEHDEEDEELLAGGSTLEVVDEQDDCSNAEENAEARSPPEESPQEFEEGMSVVVDGMKGRLRCQRLGFWSVLCEDGQIRLYEEDQMTAVKAEHSEDEGAPSDEVDDDEFEVFAGTRSHGKRRSSWQRARAKLALIKTSAVLLSSRHHAALPSRPMTRAEIETKEAEEIRKKSKEAAEPARNRYAGWQKHVQSDDQFDWNGPVHLMEEYSGLRSQAWRHHLALQAAQAGTGGIEAIVADRHRRDFIIRSAAGPEIDGNIDGVEVPMPPPRFACGNSPLSDVVPRAPMTPPPTKTAKVFGASLDGPFAGSARAQARTPAAGAVHGPLQQRSGCFTPVVGEHRWPPLPGTPAGDSSTSRQSTPRRGQRTSPGTSGTALNERLWRMKLVTVDEPWATSRLP